MNRINCILAVLLFGGSSMAQPLSANDSSLQSPFALHAQLRMAVRAGCQYHPVVARALDEEGDWDNPAFAEQLTPSLVVWLVDVAKSFSPFAVAPENGRYALRFNFVQSPFDHAAFGHRFSAARNMPKERSLSLL